MVRRLPAFARKSRIALLRAKCAAYERPRRGCQALTALEEWMELSSLESSFWAAAPGVVGAVGLLFAAFFYLPRQGPPRR